MFGYVIERRLYLKLCLKRNLFNCVNSVNRPLFHPDRSLVAPIVSVYVDTTFCLPEVPHIPSRDECKNVIIKTISEWMSRSDKCTNQIAHIFSRSSYGYEYLMIALARHFRCEIHVSDNQYRKYQHVPDIYRVLTTNSLSTKIHFCQAAPINTIEEDMRKCMKRVKFDRSALPCAHLFSNLPPNVLQIIPSVMYFTRGKVTPAEMVVCESEKVVRVCYSSLSSYSEIVDFLTHLKPRFIYPNVRPNQSLSLLDVRNTLAFLQQCSSHSTQQLQNSSIKRPSGTTSLDSYVSFKKKRNILFIDDEKVGSSEETVNQG